MNLIIKKIVFVLFITSLGGVNANEPYGNPPTFKPFRESAFYFVEDCVGDMKTADFYPHSTFMVPWGREEYGYPLVKPYTINKEFSSLKELPKNYCISLSRVGNDGKDDGVDHGSDWYPVEYVDKNIRFLLRGILFKKDTYTVEAKFNYTVYKYNKIKNCYSKTGSKSGRPSSEDISEKCFVPEQAEAFFIQKVTLKEASKDFYFEKKYSEIFGKKIIWWSKGEFKFIIKNSKGNEVYRFSRFLKGA